MGIASFIYKKALLKRYDDDHIIHYFSYQDFPGMKARPISFRTPEGLLLKGNIYSYEGANQNDLVIFCHGIGGGHRSYMREIEVLAKAGYEVLSYDNAGCFESEGTGIRAMSESINDLDSCLAFIKSDDELKNRRLSLVGHSWGGFAVGGILNFHDIFHSVNIISTFDSLDILFDRFADGKLKAMKKGILKYERKTNPKYANASVSEGLNRTSAKVFVVHSKDDRMLDIEAGLRFMKANVTNPNVRFVEVDGKGHNPNYTEDAVSYMNSTFGEYNRLVKKKTLKTFEQKQAYMNGKDFWRMTEQDPQVWKEILDNLK